MKAKQQRLPIRLIICIFLILIELLIVIFTILHLSEKSVFIYTIAEFISILTVLSIVNRKGVQSYKIMWIIFILLIPLFGVTAYLLWGGERVFPHIKKRMQHCINKYNQLFPEDYNILSRINYSDLIHYRQAEYIRREANMPIYDGTSSEYFSPGEEFFPKLLKELKKAEKYIFIEFFILSEGTMWDEIFEILKEKAKNSVEIKIIFDDFGSIKTQGKDFIKTLRNAGIEVSSFNPIVPSINIFMNYRDHRKIIVIDGKVAFTGGINIADEYVNRKERFGYWMDSAILVRGKAVNSFLSMFCAMWEFTTGRGINYLSHKSDFVSENDGFYIPYCDGPLDNKTPAMGIYMQILNNAQKYVNIATPYLILESNMLNSLCLAAKSGVEVNIITPSIPDKWYVHPVTQYYYDELLEAGVHIYEYKPGFIHSKLFLSDDKVATVGSVNMDYRSFYLHFECGVWMCNTKTIYDIKQNFNELLLNSVEIKQKAWSQRPKTLKFKQSILHLFAPFM